MWSANGGRGGSSGGGGGGGSGHTGRDANALLGPVQTCQLVLDLLDITPTPWEEDKNGESPPPPIFIEHLDFALPESLPEYSQLFPFIPH